VDEAATKNGAAAQSVSNTTALAVDIYKYVGDCPYFL